MYFFGFFKNFKLRGNNITTLIFLPEIFSRYYFLLHSEVVKKGKLPGLQSSAVNYLFFVEFLPHFELILYFVRKVLIVVSSRKYACRSPFKIFSYLTAEDKIMYKFFRSFYLELLLFYQWMSKGLKDIDKIVDLKNKTKAYLVNRL